MGGGSAVSMDRSILSMNGSVVGMDGSVVGKDGSAVGPDGFSTGAQQSTHSKAQSRPSVIAKEAYINSIVQHLADCHAVLTAVEWRFEQLKKQWSDGLVEVEDVKRQVHDLLSEVEEQESEMDDINIDLFQECKHEVKTSKLDRGKQIRHLTSILDQFLESLPAERAIRRQLSGRSGEAVRHLSIMRKDITQLEVQTTTLKEFWSRGQLDPTEARTRIDEYLESIRNLEKDASIPQVGSLRSGRKEAQSLRWDIRPRLGRVTATLEELSMKVPSMDEMTGC